MPRFVQRLPLNGAKGILEAVKNHA